MKRFLNPILVLMLLASISIVPVSCTIDGNDDNPAVTPAEQQGFFSDAINKLIDENFAMVEKDGVKFNRLADMLGLKPNALASRMKRGNFSTDTLNEMLNVFGYKIMLVPCDVDVKNGWYEVENSHEDETEGNASDEADTDVAE